MKSWIKEYWMPVIGSIFILFSAFMFGCTAGKSKGCQKSEIARHEAAYYAEGSHYMIGVIGYKDLGYPFLALTILEYMEDKMDSLSAIGWPDGESNMHISGRMTRWPYCFSVTLDEKLNDMLIKYCQKHDCQKTELFRMLLAKELGIKGYEIKVGGK